MSRKPKDPPPKKEVGGPAYMVQYAALMMILLSFFILMLTMGQEKQATFKAGSGQIRNLVQFTGGTGVLDFWRSMLRPAAPAALEQEEQPEATLLGHQREAMDQFSLEGLGLRSIEFEDSRRTLRIPTAIRFEPGRFRVAQETRFALDQAVAMLYSMRDSRIVVVALVDTGDPDADRLLAAQRAAWLTQYISDQARVPRGNISALGMARSLEHREADEPVEVMFLLRGIGAG